MKARLLVAIAMLGLASTATAQGINLSWRECGVNGTPTLTWACNSNVDADPPRLMMTASFTPFPFAQQPLVSVEGTVTWISGGLTFPAWWQFGTHGPGGAQGCRADQELSVDVNPLGTSQACKDAYNGATPTIGSTRYWGVPDDHSGRVYAHLSVPLDQAASLEDGLEYNAFSITLGKEHTVGLGACSGCSEPLCIRLDYITLTYADNSMVTLTNPLNSNLISWQSLTPLCFPPDPVRTRTWGQIKSLYR